jgi:uncharacterized protein YjbI with pentapeptide repeats
MDRDEALKLLRGGPEGVAEWNRLRVSGEEIPDLAEANLIGADLSKANLSRANLGNANLIGANLIGAKLIGAKLIQANLSNANLIGANLIGAKLGEAKLFRANLREANLREAKLYHADLSAANLIQANLSAANLIEAKLRQAKLYHADLSGADLIGADLIAAHLSGAHLRGAHLRGADLSGADLSGADLIGADLSEAGLSGADLSGAHLRGADLSGADLSGADLRATDLSEADLRLANRARVYGHGADFNEDDLSSVFCLPELRRTAAQPSLLTHVPRLATDNRTKQLLRAALRRIALRFRQLIALSATPVDPVDCSVFAPPSVRTGDWLMVQIFIHRPDQTEEAGDLAKELDEEARRRGFQTLEMEIERGAVLNVEIRVPGIKFDVPILDLRWLGRPTYVAFRTLVPDAASVGIVAGNVTVRRGDVPIGSITLKITILGPHEPPPMRTALLPVAESARRYRKAFISYASPDRPEVLKRVQMLRLARIRYFQDVLKLEPGDRWERKLYHHIDRSDLFLLFWSTNAKKSEWVLKETLYAKSRKGSDPNAPPDIVPVIIEGPPVPAPPDELSDLHFNDYLIYFMKGQNQRTPGADHEGE